MLKEEVVLLVVQTGVQGSPGKTRSRDYGNVN